MKNTSHAFPRLDRFNEAVDCAIKCTELPEGKYVDYKEAYADIQAIFSGEHEQNKSPLSPLNGKIGDELGIIAKEASIAYLVRSDKLEPCFTLAHVLRDALRQLGNVAVVRSDDERWILAIRIAWAHVSRRDPERHPKNQPAPRDVTFAHAVNFFNDRGIDLPLVGDEARLDAANTRSLFANAVWSPMRALGDTHAMKLIDDLLHVRYDVLIRRVHLHPTPDLISMKMDRSLPFGYLYRLALKTLGLKRTTASPLAMRNAAQIAATNLAAVYDVEAFSAYESVFPPHSERILEVLVNIARYDELFTVPQCVHDIMHNLLWDIFGALPSNKTITGWDTQEALILWRLLLELTVENAGSTFVKRSHFEKSLHVQVGRKTATALMKDFVLKNPNHEYGLPVDAHSADTRECAIAEASGNRIWLAPRPFLGPAFFSRLLANLSEADVDVNGRIGKAFENRMFARMQTLGIRCRRGDLGKKSAKSGDADLIVETDRMVALCEFKKKALTRQTNSGNDLQLVTDLARGLVSGVNQLAKQELELRTSGSLQFTDGTVMSLSGRRIVKIVISLSDHGGLHDAATVRHTLRALQGATLTPKVAITEVQRSNMDEVNVILKTLEQRSLEFAKLGSVDQEGDLFDGLLFHNIFFVEQLLLTERTAEKLLGALMTGMRMVTGTRDPFFDYARFH